MKRIFTIISALFLGSLLHAQSLSPVVLSSGGSYTTASIGSLSATIGEVTVQTFYSSSNMLTQGFQQSYLNGSGVQTLSFAAGNISMYPNPASEDIYFDILLSRPGTVRIELFDILGNKVSDISNITANGSNYNASHSVRGLSAGMYLAKVTITRTGGVQENYMQKFIVHN